jgi:nicotinamide mononucleotide transporter
MLVVEIIAVFFGILGVWLTTQQNVWCWAAGIANVTLYTFIFYDQRLFGDAALQVFYMFISYYGWYQWVYGSGKETELSVRGVHKKEFILLSVFGLIFFFVILFILKKIDGDLPYFDSFTTVLSVIATWMTTKKIIENWIIWIFTDAVYTFLYFYKELYLTSALYAAFTLLAILGWIEWKKTLVAQQ